MNNINNSDILVAEMLQLPRLFHRWEAGFYDGWNLFLCCYLPCQYM